MHQVEHAGKWHEIISRSGLNLYAYVAKEQSLHGAEHFLRTTWDNDLYRWVPTKKRVIYSYGENPEVISIWIEDYDALGWFGCGKWDLELLATPSCLPVTTMARWRSINIPANNLEARRVVNGDEIRSQNPKIFREAGFKLTPVGLFCCFLSSLLVHYLFHLYVSKEK
jgi:hypothetical protein